MSRVQDKQDETLKAYFMQMLKEEEPLVDNADKVALEQQDKKLEQEQHELLETASNLVKNDVVVNDNASSLINTSKESTEPTVIKESSENTTKENSSDNVVLEENVDVDIYNSVLSDLEQDNLFSHDETPIVYKQKVTEEKTESLPYKEGVSLESLLEHVEDHVVTEPLTKVEESTIVADPTLKVEETTKVLDKEQEKIELAQAIEEKVSTDTKALNKVTVNQDSTTDTSVESQAQEDSKADTWENIETEREFQTLFFTVQGVRFAVPLINLGGIFEAQEMTSIFGKPKWYMGMTDIRGKKYNVVDTLRWVNPAVDESPDKYPYLIALGQSGWALGCDKLEGNRTIDKNKVKWRQHAGSRPWLAGIVKDEMCALLHVEQLILLFNKGLSIKDLS